MAEFAVFVVKQGGSFSKAAMQQFKQQNLAKFTGDNADVGTIVDGLDEKVKLVLTVGQNGSYLPIPNSNNNRWTATVGSQALPRDNPKAVKFAKLLQGLERIFESGATGAFEIPEERAPVQNMRFPFATAKFVDDHVCNTTKTKVPQMMDEARAVGERRMIRSVRLPGPSQPGQEPPSMNEFTNIPASSTLDLHSAKVSGALRDEINARQKEFEAIYTYLVSAGKRSQTLLLGDHEEVMYTTKTKLDFYECAKGNTADDDLVVQKFAQNYLRYAVQKVGDKWLLHHMGGRAAEGQVGVAPNNFQAFNYANVQGITAVPGTFTRIG
jgi:hypothetical protein